MSTRARVDPFGLHVGDTSLWLLEGGDQFGKKCQTELQVEDYLQRLHADGDATAYPFECLHCGDYLAYSDRS